MYNTVQNITDDVTNLFEKLLNRPLTEEEKLEINYLEKNIEMYIDDLLQSQDK